MNKKISALLYQFFKRVYMLPKGFTAGCGSYVARVWLFANKLFFHGYVFFSFKGFGMAGKVAVGYPKELLKGSEVSVLVNHEYTHNTQPDAVVKRLVYML